MFDIEKLEAVQKRLSEHVEIKRVAGVDASYVELCNFCCCDC